jgi:polysaccharide pyruvyl transferase WcaK-like protein
MRLRLRNLAQSLEFAAKASYWLSRMLIVLSLIRPRLSSDGASHFLLPSVGNGNIGDQAMVESFINYVGVGDCILIVEDAADFRKDNNIFPEPRIIEIPHLIHGNFIQQFFALISILRISNKVKSLSVIGADIMDGVYSQKQSINRLFLLRVFNSLEIDTRITGFSWAPNARALPIKLLRIISNKTKLYVRDPKSVQRLHEQNIFQVYQVADLVFSDLSLDGAPDIDRWTSTSTKPIVVVNISGLGLKDTQLYLKHIRQYQLIVEYLRINGFRLLVLPHVFGGGGDTKISDDLFDSTCGSEDLLITDPLSPAQERHLFQSVSFVITGRMHIAILALNMGIPVIALETMGKVMGLFEVFNLEDYCIDKNLDFSAEVIHRIKQLENDQPSISQLISAKIPDLRKLSLINFTDLKSL